MVTFLFCGDKGARVKSVAPQPFNMLGRLPVLSVPSGMGGNSLPTSIQIVARHLDDERVFHIATALEAAQPWLDCPERRPFC